MKTSKFLKTCRKKLMCAVYYRDIPTVTSLIHLWPQVLLVPLNGKTPIKEYCATFPEEILDREILIALSPSFEPKSAWDFSSWHGDWRKVNW